MLLALAFVYMWTQYYICGPSDKRSKGKASEVTLNSLMTVSKEEDTKARAGTVAMVMIFFLLF